MLLSPSKSQNSAFRSLAGQNWISPGLSKEGITKVAQKNVESRFRVLIVDRDSMSGDLLANALAHERRCEAVTIQAPDLMPTLATGQVDLVVISSEAEANRGDGFDLAAAVDRSYPNIGIVILLNTTTQDSVIKAFRSGARGVFSRQQSMPEFFDCIEHVKKGYIWAGKQETSSLVETFKSIPAFNLVSAREFPTLTARELQVVHCAARGKTNRAIANELSLSEHTVKNYLFRAFEKLGVSSRVELLFYLALRKSNSTVSGGAEMPEDEKGIE